MILISHPAVVTMDEVVRDRANHQSTYLFLTPGTIMIHQAAEPTSSNGSKKTE
jgi:hypothetical protein